MNIAEKIKLIRSQIGINQANFAKLLSIHPQTLSRYERDELIPSADILIKIAQQTGVNPTWLLTGEGDMFLNKDTSHTRADGEPRPDPDEYSYIPLYDVKAAAGAGFIIEQENIIDFLAFKTSWIKNELKSNIKDLFLVFAIGDSMHPTISDSDIILGDKSKVALKKDGIYILRINDSLLIKRLSFGKDTITVISDNKIYPPQTLPSGQLDIVGKAIWHGHKI